MIDYIIKFGLIVLVLVPVYLLMRKPWKYERSREICMGLFVISTIGVLFLAFETELKNPIDMIRYGISRLWTGERMNLVPFKTISAYLAHSNVDLLLLNLVGNMVMFVPWGFGIVLLWKSNQKPMRVILLCLGFTVFIEFVQLFIGRSVDVDDLILNFIGGILGSISYFIVVRVFPKIKNLAK